jgi:hypothetical protein
LYLSRFWGQKGEVLGANGVVLGANGVVLGANGVGEKGEKKTEREKGDEGWPIRYSKK